MTETVYIIDGNEPDGPVLVTLSVKKRTNGPIAGPEVILVGLRTGFLD